MSRPRIRMIHYWATSVVSVVSIAAMAPVTNADLSASQTGRAVITIVIPKETVATQNEAQRSPIHRKTEPASPAPTISREPEPAVSTPTLEPKNELPDPVLPEQVVLDEPHPTEAPPHQAEESMAHEDPS